LFWRLRIDSHASLESRSSRYPNGIGNGSGVIGKLCEQVRFHVRDFCLSTWPASRDDGIGGEHIYMPRFNHRGRLEPSPWFVCSSGASAARPGRPTNN
jgi:hypothetical protein